MADVLEQRKEKVLTFLKTYQSWLVYGILAIILLLTFLNRIAPLPNIIDSTTQDYIPIEIDSFAFLRYAQEILVNGTLADVDTLRYSPDGYPNTGEFTFLATFIVYLYKFLHFFDSSVTLAYADVLYPPITFVISLLFFFLLARRLFDYRVGLLATAYLAFIPTYVQRTIAGFSDKESLGMMFFFITLYFFVVAYQQQHRARSIIFGVISGLATFFMALAWGGVQFLFLVLGLYLLIEILFNRQHDHHFFAYSSWFVTSFLPLFIFYPARYSFPTLLFSPTTAIPFFVFLISVLYQLLVHYDPFKLHTRFHEKYPVGVISFTLAAALGLAFVLLYLGPTGLFQRITEQIYFLTSPFGESRWGLTVAESHQPYMRDFVAQLGKIFFALFLAGAIFVFYNLLAPVKENRKKLTFFFALFVLAFTLNRYSPDSSLNGDNSLSLFLFFGSFILFFLFILIASLHVYRKRREHYLELTKLNGSYILVLVWFFVTIVGARTMVRLILMFSPTVVLLTSCAFVFLYDLGMRQRHHLLRIVTIVILLCLLLLPAIQGSLVSFYQQTSLTTTRSGPIYTQQWQHAMQWVRENTPTDAVFAHWWDYGYWVQTGGQRATISDGGNSGGAGINFNTARYLLTTPSDTDALTYLKSRGASYALIVSEDIGKYPAFSSIGSDLSNDRYSWIPAFRLDPRNTQELRNQTVYLYSGSTGLDADIVYQDTLLPAGAAGIGGFLVPFTAVSDSQAIISQPTAVVLYNNQRYDIPIKCLVIQGKKTEFPVENGLDSCLAIIPSVEAGKFNPIGALLYLSPKTRNSFLARHYIYDESSPNFRLAYSDHEQIPLMLYDGRIVGPHRIWEATIPPSITVNETMRSSFLPDERLYYVVR